MKIRLRKPNKSSKFYGVEFVNPIAFYVLQPKGLTVSVEVGLTKEDLNKLRGKLK